MEYDTCETCLGSGIVRVSVVLCRKCLKLKNSCVENNSPDSACNNCKRCCPYCRGTGRHPRPYSICGGCGGTGKMSNQL